LLSRETTITTLEHELTIRVECESERNTLRESLKSSEVAREELRNEVDNAAEYINELE